MKIIKEELLFEENLKKRLEFICEFSKVTPTFVNGSIRKIEKTNISYIEPHRVIVKDTTFLVFNYSNDVYISNLAKDKIIWIRKLEGDYYISNITMPKQENITLNKYGKMRLNYLKKHKKADYSIMFLDGTLNTHLKDIQEQATLRVEQIIKQLKDNSDLTEEMKNTDMLYWVGTMNTIKNQAEEIICNELIYI